MTQQEIATNYETLKHIRLVQKFLTLFATELLARGEIHDNSKLEDPELTHFAELTPKLAGCTYNSDEYKSFLKELKPALDHHYAKNRHHPEHWKNGVDDMNLLDLIEMFADWKSASMRHHDGNLNKSIDINAERFNMSDQLKRIFHNTKSVVE